MQRVIFVTMKILLSSWYYLENLTKLFHMLWNFKFDVIFIMYLLANIINYCAKPYNSLRQVNKLKLLDYDVS
jgi:hypothetical protein